MKIYTRGGDKGRTSLFGGSRVAKDDARIEALGSVDELVAALGLAKAAGIEEAAHRQLETVQTQLYLLMADLASEAPVDAAVPLDSRLPQTAATTLEAAIDAMEADLPPLTDFVIPGASPASAALHCARTICRRAERRVLTAGRDHAFPPGVPVYLNRLSDWLFVLSRWVDRTTHDTARTFKSAL